MNKGKEIKIVILDDLYNLTLIVLNVHLRPYQVKRSLCERPQDAAQVRGRQYASDGTLGGLVMLHKGHFLASNYGALRGLYFHTQNQQA